jgi:hypothetical protein
LARLELDYAARSVHHTRLPTERELVHVMEPRTQLCGGLHLMVGGVWVVQGQVRSIGRRAVALTLAPDQAGLVGWLRDFGMY